MARWATFKRYARFGGQVVVAAAGGLLLAGCFLRSLAGNVVLLPVEDSHITRVLAEARAGSTVTICSLDVNGTHHCTYIVDGEVLTSALSIFSEQPLAGILIDPLIAQVPADVGAITATYDVGGGPQPLLVEAVASFRVTTGITATAEAGHKFIILELPPAIEATLPLGDPEFGLPISYTLAYERELPIGPPVGPQTIKLMLAGRVALNGQKYYLPLLPCVTNFASVPALSLPVAATPQDLTPAIGALLAANPDAACDGQVYFFAHLPAAPEFTIYLPWLRR